MWVPQYCEGIIVLSGKVIIMQLGLPNTNVCVFPDKQSYSVRVADLLIEFRYTLANVLSSLLPICTSLPDALTQRLQYCVWGTG